MDRTRPYLPVLLAMTGSSPFHDGIDTGHDSYRTMWWSRWPMTGPPEYLGSAERFAEVVAGLVASGVVADASHLYWDVRPSYHLPTLEFRLADVCTEVDDVVLHAALVRSLVRVLAGRAERGEPCPRPRPELLRAARWRAARHGLDGGSCSTRSGASSSRRGSPSAGSSPSCRTTCATTTSGASSSSWWNGCSSAAPRRRGSGGPGVRTGDWREVAARIVREGTALESG